MFTALKCSTCGGKIEVTPADQKNLFISHGGVFIFTGTNATSKFRCAHCGTEFLRNDEFEQHTGGDTYAAVNTGSGAIAQGPGSIAAGAGGIAIGGSTKTGVRISNLSLGGDLVISKVHVG